MHAHITPGFIWPSDTPYINELMTLSFQKLFFILAFAFGIFALLILAKPVLIPLTMALLLSFILFPVVKKLEGWGVNGPLAALLSMLMVFVVLGGGIALASAQIVGLSDEMSNFSGQVMEALSSAVVYINDNVNFIDDLDREQLIDEGKEWLSESSGMLIQNTFSGVGAFFTGLIATIIFTFLLLIYRKGLTHAFVSFGDPENRGHIFEMLKRIQSVGKKYLSGMFLLILILGTANSIGLWIIGIDSPFLFGFLAGFLCIIPYIGTLIGAAIAVLYAFISTDSLWVPGSVILLFWGMQILEANFLNPKIVGSSVNVNPLIAIISLLTGAAVWGIAGMIMFLPFVAILKVICEEFEQLKPVAMIISDDITGDSHKQNKLTKWFRQLKAKITKD